MADDDRTHVTDAGTRDTDGALVHTHDISHFKIPDGDPDPRGWDVRTADGQKLGKVADLLVDTGTNQVRYLEVEVDKDFTKQGARDYYLVPVGAARLDDDRDDVVVNLGAADLVDVPVYERGRVTRDYESSLRTHLRSRSSRTDDALTDDTRTAGTVGTGAGALAGATAGRDTDFYTGPEYDDRSFFGSRRASGRGLGDRVADGVDDVKDRFDGNPASRPGPDATDRSTYGTGASAPGTGVADRTAGTVDRGTNRAANALDDVKDRVDGNPASRPGPDATDRPERR